ncbi:uncharacterized protein EHS24_007478 [Apiotrichum porosum]|uniref:TauD/TfdA-like domain-containing protein n=1 Tax=Apiotrichum porosum TaxID=105984 RepID=A0A427XUH2_9TREE|nr:uncharacterized protein EHS24_007478 [Apiotrichum porosum]RSH82498.1 hypothetical protein EHS24_007478 [Apiotrichum porosum]
MSSTITQTTQAPTEGVAKLSLSGAPAVPNNVWFSSTGLPESEYPYKHYLPSLEKKVKGPPLTEFVHVDPGHEALKHAEPRAFLAAGKVENLSPRLGSVVEGVQLHKLDTAARQDLALFVAQRGVVAFRDQDFIDQDASWLVNDWTAFWGRPHVHHSTVQPVGHPELHLVYRAAGSDYNYDLSDRSNSTNWHSDVSYERQPPGLTALFLFDSPDSGGDTGYVDQRNTYQRLTPSFREYLETLSVLHSGVQQVQSTLDGKYGSGQVGRDPVENVHPLVRRHPVTGEKALYINRTFSRHIVGLKREESEALLNFLYDHIERGQESQVRVSWKPRTVVLWDNRITAHTANLDFDNTPARRHGARLTPQAERPTL